MAGGSSPLASQSCSCRALRPLMAATSREEYVFFNCIGKSTGGLGAARLLRLESAHLVQSDARSLDGIERFRLELGHLRTSDRTGKGSAGDGAMIRALGLLERLEGGSVLALPIEPPREPRDRLVLRGRRALDAERIAVVVAEGASNPLALPLAADDTRDHSAPNLAGASGASIGSTRFSGSKLPTR